LNSTTVQSAPAPGWIERWYRRIEQRLAQPQSYEWARSNWATRWLVRRRTQQLFGWMSGFVQSQVLLACVRLRLLNALAEHPQTLEALSVRLQVPEPPLWRLLSSAVAMGLLRQDASKVYRLGAAGHVLLSQPGITAMIEHNQLLYADMCEPDAFLRRTAPGQMGRYWTYAHDTPAAKAAAAGAADLVRYSGLMDASQGFVITEILDSFPFQMHRQVLDIGCGKGRFMTALAQRHAHLSMQLFDLPAVVELARQRLEQEQLLGRVQCVGGSFVDDPLPQGADLVTLVRVLHDHDDDTVAALLRKVWEILPAGGRVMIAEPMCLPQGQGEVVDPYFHFYLLAMGAGRLRRPAEIARLLTQSGFSGVEQVPTAMPIHAQIVTAQKIGVNPRFGDKASI
jgi:demethylspheroidene O-methyltransferase